MTGTTAPSLKKSLLESKGQELQSLLDPVPIDVFVRQYWGKEPLFVKGHPGKYKGLFDRAAFMRGLAAAGAAPPEFTMNKLGSFLQASFDKNRRQQSTAAAPGEHVSKTLRVAPDQALALFNEGATLCATQFEVFVPELAPFLGAIKRQLGFMGKACFNAYLSPPRTGFNWHFDARIASTLQIEGTKKWRFSNHPAVTWPPYSGALRQDGKAQYSDAKRALVDWAPITPLDEKDTREVVLEPGDLLILPAGVWHEACAGDAVSLSLNLSFTPVSTTLLVRELLEGLMNQNPEWRSPRPLPPRPGGAPGEVDADGIAALGAQLAAAGEALRALGGDAAAAVRAYTAFVQNPNPGAPAPTLPFGPAGPVSQEQRLRVRADGNLLPMLADGGAHLHVAVGVGRGVEVTGESARFVQRILEVREFRAGDCLEWGDGMDAYAWSDVQALLTKLRHEGVLEDAPAR